MIGEAVYAVKNFPALSMQLTAFLLLIWTILSFVFSSTRSVGLDIVIRDGLLLLAFLWLIGMPAAQRGLLREAFVRVLGWLTIAVCGVGSVIFVLQPNPRFVGIFFDGSAAGYFPNACAAFLLLGWPAVWVMLRGNRLRPVITGAVLGCLMLTGSRSAWIVLVIQLLIMGIPLIRTAWRPVATALISVVLVIGGLTLVRSFFPIESIDARITFTDASGVVPVTERLSLWKSAVKISLNHPLFGGGPGSFPFLSQPYQTSVLATSDDPHNVILGYAAERGWIAALLLMIICCVILIPPLWRRTDLWTTALWLGTSGFFLHSLLNRNLMHASLVIIFWLSLGLIANHNSLRLRWKSRIVEVAFGVILLLIVTMSPPQGDGLLIEARQLLDAARGGEAEVRLIDYLGRNGEDPRAWTLLGDSFLQQGNASGALISYDRGFALGRLNYPDAAEGFVRVALALDDPSVITERSESIDQTIGMWVHAIEMNDHYAARTDAPEKIVQLMDDLSLVSPEYEKRYVYTREHVLAEAARYREEAMRQPHGFLW